MLVLGRDEREEAEEGGKRRKRYMVVVRGKVDAGEVR